MRFAGVAMIGEALRMSNVGVARCRLALVLALACAACISKPDRKPPGDGSGDLQWSLVRDDDLLFGAGAGVRIAYVPNIGVVAYDDGADQLWQLSDLGWMLFDAQPVAAATKHGAPGFAYDRHEQSLRLFGGVTVTDTYENDFYEYVPGGTPSWHPIVQTTPPSQRSQSSLVPTDTDLYLIGGYDGAAIGDVWKWTGTGWNQRHNVAPGTQLRSPGTSATWDTDHQRILVLENTAAGESNELWAFDPTANMWACLMCNAADPERTEASIIHIPGRDLTLLIGGTRAGQIIGGTMKLVENGVDPPHWEDFDTAMPPGRSAATLAYDFEHDKVYMFGGYGDGPHCVSVGCADTFVLSAP